MKSKYCNKARRTRSHLGTNKLPSNRRHQKNAIKETETNLSRFWRECRERDIRKRRKMCNQFPSNHNHFNSTKSKLKLDAEILSNRFQRINSLKNNKENRRNSMFNNSRNISKANKKNTNRRFSNIYIPSSTNTSNNKTNDEQTQSENTKIFFENKEYYSSLYNKHNPRKSNIRSVHNYFDSLKSDENTIKTRLRQKWQELKKDVNKLNYFNNNKLNKTTQKINLNNTTMQQPSVKTEATKPKYYPTPKSNLTYCFKLPPQKEQKDPESQSNETITQLEPEMFEDNISKTPKNEEITVESVGNIQQSDIIEDTHDHSSIYCLSNVAKSNEYWDFSVRQLKNKLLNMNVSINNCIEKKDLIEKIKTGATATNNNESTNTLNNKYYRKQAPKSAKDVHSKCIRTSFSNKNKPSILYDTIFNDTRESKQQIMKRIDVWIHRWSYRRNFRQLLNSIFEYKLNDKRYLSRHDDNYLLMMKLYKKAILLIHPDKHVNSSFEIKYKSAEMFKILINIADRYKKKHEIRNKAY